MDSIVKIDRSFCVLYAFMLLTVPLNWVFSAVLSALIHEIFHIAAIKLCGRKILAVNIGVFGAEIQTDLLSGWQEILCLAAGPIGSLSLLLLFRWIPLAALTGAIQGIFNLLPIRPLDGGRILNSLLVLSFGDDHSAKIMAAVEMIVLLCITVFASYCFFVLKLSAFLSLLMILPVIQRLFRKIPCKLSQLGVQ